MSLNDTFIKNSTRYSGMPSGNKHSDGGGLYLHVTAAGKYWRMNYRLYGKQKTLSLGVYPSVSLRTGPQGRDEDPRNSSPKASTRAWPNRGKAGR